MGTNKNPGDNRTGSQGDRAVDSQPTSEQSKSEEKPLEAGDTNPGTETALNPPDPPEEAFLFKDSTMQQAAKAPDVAAIVAQVILRELTMNSELVITQAQAQEPRHAIGERLVVFDMWGEDSEGDHYDIEFQRNSAGARYVRQASCDRQRSSHV